MRNARRYAVGDAGLGDVREGARDHLGGEVEADHLPSGTNLLRRQDVDPAAAAEVDHHLASLQVGEPRRVAASTGEIEGPSRNGREIGLGVEAFADGVPAGGVDGLFLPATALAVPPDLRE